MGTLVSLWTWFLIEIIWNCCKLIHVLGIDSEDDTGKSKVEAKSQIQYYSDWVCTILCDQERSSKKEKGRMEMMMLVLVLVMMIASCGDDKYWRWLLLIIIIITINVITDIILVILTIIIIITTIQCYYFDGDMILLVLMFWWWRLMVMIITVVMLTVNVEAMKVTMISITNRDNNHDARVSDFTSFPFRRIHQTTCLIWIKLLFYKLMGFLLEKSYFWNVLWILRNSFNCCLVFQHQTPHFHKRTIYDIIIWVVRQTDLQSSLTWSLSRLPVAF